MKRVTLNVRAVGDPEPDAIDQTPRRMLAMNGGGQVWPRAEDVMSVEDIPDPAPRRATAGETTADELRAAAAAMTTEADRLDELDQAAVAGPWEPGCTCCEEDEVISGSRTVAQDVEASGDRYLIAHRRNTIGRDALTLRATARLLLDVAASIDDGEMVAGNPWAIARAFAFTGQEVPLG